MRLRCNETRLLREVYVDISDHIAKLLGVNLVVCNGPLKRDLVILLAFGVRNGFSAPLIPQSPDGT